MVGGVACAAVVAPAYRITPSTFVTGAHAWEQWQYGAAMWLGQADNMLGAIGG